MSCYKPMIRVEKIGSYLTAEDGHRYNEFKIFTTKYIEKEMKKKKSILSQYKNPTLIPCGRCIGCRLDYSREWADRAYLEMKEIGKEKCYFVTLTYDNKNLPMNEEVTTSKGFTITKEDAYLNDIEWQGNLDKKDLQRFFNTLRKKMERLRYNKEGIRYLAAGEYGEKDRRPHYHMILFNINLPAESFYSPKIINKEMHYKNKIIEEAWGKGFIDITEASWNTSAYVGRYITKKLYGNIAEEERAKLGQSQAEFLTASNRPPLGNEYYKKHKEEIYKNDEITIFKKGKTENHKPPKYFDRLLEKENPELWEKIKEKRKIEAENAIALKGKKTSLNMWNQLQIELSSKEDKGKTLKRPLTSGEKE